MMQQSTPPKISKKNLKHKVVASNLKRRLFAAKELVKSQLRSFEVVGEFELANIRYYAANNEKVHYRTPLVFVAPLAINMAIYDLFPQRSLVGYFADQGFDVYLIDWGNPTREQQDKGFNYYVNVALPPLIKQIQDHSKQHQISLHGWSMAGTFCTLYTAKQTDDHVKNLIILASPIDTYLSGGRGKRFKLAAKLAKEIEKNTGFHPHKISTKLLYTPGWINALGFKIIDPVGTLKGHWHFLKNLEDQHVVEAHATLGSFLNNMVAYPGGINRDMVLNIWLYNPLSTGKFELNGETLELKNIHSSLLVAAGGSDQIVAAEAAKPLTKLTSSQDIKYILIPESGHLGVISNTTSQRLFWPALEEWLADRSEKID